MAKKLTIFTSIGIIAFFLYRIFVFVPEPDYSKVPEGIKQYVNETVQCSGTPQAVAQHLNASFPKLRTGWRSRIDLQKDSLIGSLQQARVELTTFWATDSCSWNGCKYHFFAHYQQEGEKTCRYAGMSELPKGLFLTYDVIFSKPDSFGEECVAYVEGFCISKISRWFLVKSRVQTGFWSVQSWFKSLFK